MMRDWFLELGMLRTDDEKKAEVEAVMVILVIQRFSLFLLFSCVGRGDLEIFCGGGDL